MHLVLCKQARLHRSRHLVLGALQGLHQRIIRRRQSVAGRQVVGVPPPPESRCRDRWHCRISLAVVAAAAAAAVAAAAVAAAIAPAAATGPPQKQDTIAIVLLLLTQVGRQPAPLARRSASGAGVAGTAGAEG
jgi:hypothetical protein